VFFSPRLLQRIPSSGQMVVYILAGIFIPFVPDSPAGLCYFLAILLCPIYTYFSDLPVDWLEEYPCVFWIQPGCS
jgi:hypothetical protein